MHIKILYCGALCLNNRANADTAYMLRIDNLKSTLYWDYFEIKIFLRNNIIHCNIIFTRHIFIILYAVNLNESQEQRFINL